MIAPRRSFSLWRKTFLRVFQERVYYQSAEYSHLFRRKRQILEAGNRSERKGKTFPTRVDISTAKIRGKYQRRIRDFEPGSENVSRQCTYVMCVYTHARSPLATTRFRAKGFLGWWKRVFFLFSFSLSANNIIDKEGQSAVNQ